MSVRAAVLALAVATLVGPAPVPAAVVGPPAPPPVSSDPPPGHRPGPAPGLRAQQACSPAAPDAPAPGAAGIPDAATRMQLDAVHRLATGAGQVVAVIDTGVERHPQLGSRLRAGGDYLTGGDGFDDCDGHGTAVAGVIAAAADAPGGMSGMAPGATVLAIRQSSPSYAVAGPSGSSHQAGDTETLADAIVLAVREGAGVINISEAVCVAPGLAATTGESVHAALRFAARSDVVVVAAAGNVGSGSCAAAGTAQVPLPAWYDELLAVGAVGPDDAPADFTVPGPWVDVAAPGTDMRSLAVGGGTTDIDVRGTSFAAPWAAGLAALIRQRFPALTAAQVTDRIIATARRPAGGRNDTVGNGVIDPVAALTAVPAVLDRAVAAAAPQAELPPAPTPPALPAGGAGLDLTATAALLAAGALAAWQLRRRRPA
ncbi:type VII secretion-associated serine protease mycosin [Pseudonocardia sp. GCM10023141]|uniref:type VII secretion-associated serine protease mycosin n=1 Tax=Pseudonocardia sp. GCM10023141 TaxID=3252653 RepID=UPI00360ECE87